MRLKKLQMSLFLKLIWKITWKCVYWRYCFLLNSANSLLLSEYAVCSKTFLWTHIMTVSLNKVKTIRDLISEAFKSTVWPNSLCYLKIKVTHLHSTYLFRVQKCELALCTWNQVWKYHAFEIGGLMGRRPNKYDCKK